MTEQEQWNDACEGRHREFMEASERRHRELIGTTEWRHREFMIQVEAQTANMARITTALERILSLAEKAASEK